MKGLKISEYAIKLDNKVICTLCPKACKLSDSEMGFCKVRKNIGGELYNTNYGLSTCMVIEPIETNGVFNFFPGKKTLSIGSVGCNLNCNFCQAWKYTREFDKRKEHFNYYTPQDIINMAKNLNLNILAWTFNDPISSFEFVKDTAELAKKEGMINLFKSSHFINEKPIKDIMDYIDIFSISIKSINEDFYKKNCGGSLEPVKNIAKLLRENKKYIEVSNLVIPTYNNSDEDFSNFISWVKKELGINTPVHFARFHPDYKLLDVERTPIEDIHRAISIAKKQGMNYVYSGNIFIDKYLNTYCPKCGEMIIERKGERISIINNSTNCIKCGEKIDIKYEENQDEIVHKWNPEIWAIHIQIKNSSTEPKILDVHHIFQKQSSLIESFKVMPMSITRYTISMINEEHMSSVFKKGDLDIKIFENLDRAYYEIG
jgi:pyruvate formate lyase activating enzyme